MTGWELRIWRKSMLWSRESGQRIWRDAENMARLENAEQVGIATPEDHPGTFSLLTCCLTCRGCVRQISSGDWKLTGGNGRECVSVIHSLAECQATAHQETAFSVLHRKSRDLLNPFQRPAYIPKPAGYFPRHFKSPFV